ncbi:MAG: hypothetical protein KatS3mg076_1101 [Candidatus Binatia bacterium]|nr:MAG: hypothetical protein KatS3mg076_1101 [Candidatus Binatia bacterium]
MHRRVDAVILGSALGGLVAAAYLCRQGRRVAVLEHAPRVGGRLGGSPVREGYWVDFGHREGHDVGDCQFAWYYGAQAAAELDVDIPLRKIDRPLRVHRVDAGVVREGDWAGSGFFALAEEILGCPRASVAGLASLFSRAARATPEEVASAIGETLPSWLERNERDPAVRQAALRFVAVVFHRHPETASAGRWMQFFRIPKAGPFVAAHPRYGGMQGLVEPWAEAVRTSGGEIFLGWKPVRILLERGRVRGALAVDEANLVLEVEAPVVVVAYPVWEVFSLVAAESFPAAWVERARALTRYRSELAAWVAGLRRLPRIRAEDRPEDFPGWNRLLRGEGRDYFGGFQITSLSSPACAPPGRHLLVLATVRWPELGANGLLPWEDAKHELDEARGYLSRFYVDFEDCIEWSSYQYVESPQVTGWYWAPVERHSVEVPGVEGLFFAGSTVEAPAGIVDLAAYSGREAARKAQEFLSRLPAEG